MESLLKPTVIRSERIALRLSPAERNKIEMFCLENSMSLSDFVRQCISLVEPGLIIENVRS